MIFSDFVVITFGHQRGVKCFLMLKIKKKKSVVAKIVANEPENMV